MDNNKKEPRDEIVSEKDFPYLKDYVANTSNREEFLFHLTLLPYDKSFALIKDIFLYSFAGFVTSFAISSSDYINVLLLRKSLFCITSISCVLGLIIFFKYMNKVNQLGSAAFDKWRLLHKSYVNYLNKVEDR